MLAGCQSLGESGLDFPQTSPTGLQRQAHKEDPPLTPEELDRLTGDERNTMEVFEKYNLSLPASRSTLESKRRCTMINTGKRNYLSVVALLRVPVKS